MKEHPTPCAQVFHGVGVDICMCLLEALYIPILMLGLHKDSCKSGHSIREGYAGGLFLLFRTDKLHHLFEILEGRFTVTPRRLQAVMTSEERNLLQADPHIDQVLTEAVAQRMRCHPLQTGGSRITRQQELHSPWSQGASLTPKDRLDGPGMLAVAERA